MLETFLRLLENLADWEVYREVAAVLEPGELVAWRQLYESRPTRDVLLREAVRALSAAARYDHLEIDDRGGSCEELASQSAVNSANGGDR
jgi:hypothetical protein